MQSSTLNFTKGKNTAQLNKISRIFQTMKPVLRSQTIIERFLKASTTFVSLGLFDFTTPAQNANKTSKF